MAHTSLTREDLKCLSRVLSAALDEAVELERLEEVSEGANKHRHKKALLTSGRIIGIKAAERVRKGTLREFLLAKTARILDIPGSGASGLFQMPDGLPLSRMQVVALEWLLGADQIGKLNVVSPKRKSVETAKQLGQWIWLCLYFGVSDRGTQNWIWSEDRATIAMIDYEDWSAVSQNPERLASVVREILQGGSGAMSLEQARALLDGMNTAKASLAAAQDEIACIFASYGENHTSAYDGADVRPIAAKISQVSEADLAG